MPTIPPAIIDAAKAAQAKWKLLASFQIGQWGYESGWGARSPGNNPFGIKHMAGFPDQMFHTHEEVHGVLVPEDLVFAKFDTIAQAFDAHAMLIATRPQYAPAMAVLPDLVRFVQLLGPVYATDKGYATTLIKIIQGDGLTRYDA